MLRSFSSFRQEIFDNVALQVQWELLTWPSLPTNSGDSVVSGRDRLARTGSYFGIYSELTCTWPDQKNAIHQQCSFVPTLASSKLSRLQTSALPSLLVRWMRRSHLGGQFLVHVQYLRCGRGMGLLLYGKTFVFSQPVVSSIWVENDVAVLQVCDENNGRRDDSGGRQ